MSEPLRFDLHAAAVLAPGIGSLEELRAVCRCGARSEPDAAAYPVPTTLPANERRRASQAVKLALSCIEQVLPSSPFPADALRAVFASDEGTGEVCGQMLEALATTRQVSPLLFPNSVHNAASGYFSIALRNRRSATVVSLGVESFAAGLLCAAVEAAATREPLLLVSFDPAMTAPMDELLPVVDATASAWIISSAQAGAAPLASFELSLGPPEPPTPLPDWVPPRWRGNSSAQALAALGLLEGTSDSERRLAFGARSLGLRRIDGGCR